MDEKLLVEELEERGVSHPRLDEEADLGRKLEGLKKPLPVCGA
jgi:hypothetical protein